MVPGQSQPYRHGISQKELGRKRAAAPVLEKRYRKYFLCFSYTEEVPLTKAPVKEQIICSVDLGINTDAVCTIMRPDGTVLGRNLLIFPVKRPDVPCAGTDKQVPAGTWFCTGEKQMGLREAS